MNCIKEKKFLFWKWKVVEHNFEISYIDKFMYCSEDFHVHYHCKNCGIEHIEKFVTADELILKGFLPTELNEITPDNFGYPKK